MANVSIDAAPEPDKSNTGRIAADVAAKVQEPDDPGNIPNIEPPKKPRLARKGSIAARAKASAALANTFFFSLCRTVGGADANPTADEANELNQALTDYFIATGKTDLSPGWVVVGLYSKFILEKAFKPSVSARLRAGVEFMRMNVRTKVRVWLTKRKKLRKANGNDLDPPS